MNGREKSVPIVVAVEVHEPGKKPGDSPNVTLQLFIRALLLRIR